jgi:hypothetical protein
MRRPFLPRPILVILVLGAIVSSIALAACAGSASAPLSRTSSEAGSGTTDLAAPPMPEQAGGPVDANAAATAGPFTAPGSDTSAATGPMIVRTGSLDLQVSDVDRAVSDATRVVTGAGGYVAGSERSFNGDQPFAMLTLRIPADKWDATLTDLRALSLKVLGEKTSADEVTAQVVDMDARLKNLHATETQLLGVMQQAVKIPDILAVQAELTTVQGEIEQLQAARNNLADQAAQGTLAVSFGLAPAPVTTVTNAWDPGSVVAEATAALVGMGQGVASTAIWLVIVGLPILLTGLFVLVPLLFVVRRLARRGPPSAPAAGPTAPGPSSEAGTAA